MATTEDDRIILTSGPALFSRYAFPPNSLGYCGPTDTSLLAELVAAGDAANQELREVATAFAGAWPYLQLIGRAAGHDALDIAVVEAYWLGNSLLDRVDLLTWGNSSDDRFRSRAGWEWDKIEDALNAGGLPNHAFHVFCVYPWVGLLRSGAVEQALQVLDRCRIRWGQVVGTLEEGRVLVSSAPLTWDGELLSVGEEQLETVSVSIDPGAASVETGDLVALHWDYVCDRISRSQLGHLKRNHDLHLAIANGHGTKLASRLESAGGLGGRLQASSSPST